MKTAFSELTKITPLTCSPFYQYNECHDVTYLLKGEQVRDVIVRGVDGRTNSGMP